MKKGEMAYKKLKKKGLSDKEIAGAYILPSDFTKKEKANVDKALLEARAKLRASKAHQKHLKSKKYKEFLKLITKYFEKTIKK